MEKGNRRTFLKTTAGAALSFGMIAPHRGWSANDTIRIGVVGIRGRGRSHIQSFGSLENVDVTAICDVDENILNDRAESMKDHLKQPVKKYVDYREMLEDKDLDAVAIATPNHWHSIMGIWACQAGKDAYVEKPCSHNLYEGRKLVEAARKYNRIVQHGTQARSAPAFHEAMSLLKDEKIIGDVYYAKGLCYKWRNTIGEKKEKPVPDGVHYDLWTGPAPEKPFTENRYHYEWHWQWDYGNGDMGNQGVHEMDIARAGLGVGLPKVAQALGGHFMFEDDQETPNCLLATFKYPDEDKMLVFEVRHWMTNNELNIPNNDRPGNQVIGDVFLGTKGIMLTHGYFGYRVFFGRERKPGPERHSGEEHFKNFIDAVRSRKRSDLNAEIEEGHLSAGLCHLANTAYKLERTLHFDPDTEKCINDDEANKLLRDDVRGYRKPFVVPDEV